ncbi:hypothetical protein C0Q70_14416 [Pomacea canaliculata]|uniref:Uncharacterized protein n=1 Tax=Pomacea canaliculata TaxID=400727 RepID=A0A2T7NZY0_POMCA|nr:hypothetical protein C0Q70_14416 [Pomacea canaliculata]
MQTEVREHRWMMAGWSEAHVSSTPAPHRGPEVFRCQDSDSKVQERPHPTHWHAGTRLFPPASGDALLTQRKQLSVKPSFHFSDGREVW